MKQPYTIDRRHPSPGFRASLLVLGLLFLLGSAACLLWLPVGAIGVIVWMEVLAVPTALLLRSEASIQGGTVVPGEWLTAQMAAEREEETLA